VKAITRHSSILAGKFKGWGTRLTGIAQAIGISVPLLSLIFKGKPAHGNCELYYGAGSGSRHKRWGQGDAGVKKGGEQKRLKEASLDRIDQMR
jgi:hypothetical protein